MRILLTNDDGIHAAGLRYLYEALKSEYEVSIVAPESEMSAVGHAITLNSPLRVYPVEKRNRFYGYAVKGTPADCVKIAVKELMEAPPHIILSGINLGRNVGVDILYSGTVSAATEGAFLGYRSAAISLDTRENPDYRFAAAFGREIVLFIDENGIEDGTALNVNIPAVPPEAIGGVSVTNQGIARFEERFERRTDPRGNIYYWLAAETTLENGSADNDSRQLKENMITITPIHYDLTCPGEVKRLRACRPPSWKNLKTYEP
jgi:5'-nucleotidase